MARILIIDDSNVMRNFLREFLNNEGHDVDVAVDGDDGVRRAMATDYHLIFCDLHMPKRNGLQVYESVHAEKPLASFVFTDSMPDTVSEQLVQSRRFHVLRKPFDLQQIREVMMLLNQERVRHESGY